MKAYRPDIKKFVSERNKALRSLNKKKFTEHCRKYDVAVPEDNYIFWCGMHKAATAIADIDIAEWLLYAEWLKEQDSVPLCDRWEEAEKFIAQGGKALEPPATCDRPERVDRADTLCCNDVSFRKGCGNCIAAVQSCSLLGVLGGFGEVR